MYQVQRVRGELLAFDQNGRELGTVVGVTDLGALSADPAAIVKAYSGGGALSAVRFDLQVIERRSPCQRS